MDTVLLRTIIDNMLRQLVEGRIAMDRQRMRAEGVPASAIRDHVRTLRREFNHHRKQLVAEMAETWFGV